MHLRHPNFIKAIVRFDEKRWKKKFINSEEIRVISSHYAVSFAVFTAFESFLSSDFFDFTKYDSSFLFFPG